LGDFLSQDAIDDLIAQIGDDSGGGGGGGGGLDFGDLGDLGGSAPAASAPAARSMGAPMASPVLPIGTTKEVKPYDFARASKFSKDQIRTIQMIHETFARLFASTLAAKIRALTRIKVVSVEEVTYEDFINTVSTPSIISIFSMPPMEGNAVLDISPQIGFPIMDRLLGGAGEEDEEARELTDIEVNIMESVLHDALGFIKEAWSNVIDLNPKLELLESNPYFVQVVPPSEMIILVNLEAEVGEKNGRMNLAIPYMMLETVLPKLNIQQWFSTYRRTISPDTTLKVEERLLRTSLKFVARLGRTQISLKDFLNLNVGDILQINSKISDEMDIYVGDRVKFKGRPGVVGKRLAVQTTSVVKDVEEI
jgi:flagellar motor switch protein FliM